MEYGPKRSTKSGESRGVHRKRILLEARAVYEHGTKFHDCTILDVSETGARIGISAARDVPDRFFLINIRDRAAYDAKLVWRRGDSAGVQFEATYRLSGTLPDELAYLRNHWFECATR